MGLYLLTYRGLRSGAFYDPIYELEDIIVRTCSAQLLIVPTASDATRWIFEQCRCLQPVLGGVAKWTVGRYNIEKQNELHPKENSDILLVIAINGGELDILSSIPNWRKRFDVVLAYIFDAWAPESYSRLIYKIDHLFVPMPEIIDSLRKSFKIKVDLLSFGAGVQRIMPGQSSF